VDWQDGLRDAPHRGRFSATAATVVVVSCHPVSSRPLCRARVGAGAHWQRPAAECLLRSSAAPHALRVSTQHKPEMASEIMAVCICLHTAHGRGPASPQCLAANTSADVIGLLLSAALHSAMPRLHVRGTMAWTCSQSPACSCRQSDANLPLALALLSGLLGSCQQ